MIALLIRHMVEDYTKWKAVYDTFHDFRKTRDEQTYRIDRPVDDPNHPVLLFDRDITEHARTFLDSQELKNAIKRAGVTGVPDITIMSPADQSRT